MGVARVPRIPPSRPVIWRIVGVSGMDWGPRQARGLFGAALEGEIGEP